MTDTTTQWAPTPANQPASPVNILLVDDEPRNLDALEGILQSPDLNLVRVTTAEAALRELMTREFAALVLDIRMPRMSGIELAALVKQRQRTKDIPILFLTAHFQDDRDILAGYTSGAVDYLTKPVDPQILRSKISVFADLFEKTRDLRLTNDALAREVGQRERAEEALRRSNAELEERVRERTKDLSETNRQLAAARDRAVAASRAKDDFLARLSHELRTPLNPVLLLASDAAAKPDLPPDIRADFEMIANHVKLEARLIDDLLDLSRITQGKFSLEKRPFDFNTLLQDAVAMVRPEAEHKRLHFRVEVAPLAELVYGDDVRIRQILWNVLKNAVKFTPAGGEVSLTAGRQPASGSIEVTIRDTGIGLTPAELERVFEAFAQGEHARPQGAHKYGGLGLGLTISRTLADLHGGSIRAHSPGRNAGSTFVVELPLPGAGPAPAGGPCPAPAPARRRILLVEDHESTRLSLVQLLERRGFEVRAAGSLAEARRLAGSETFDILLSDVGLPDGSGYDLMADLRGRAGLTGIALTGYGMEEDVSRSQRAGFAAHLTKPVSAAALDRALASHAPGPAAPVP